MCPDIVFYQNVGVADKNFRFFRIDSINLDIVCKTETWLNNEVLSPEPFSKKYDVFRGDRETLVSTKKGGSSVLIATRNELQARRCYELVSDAEDVWVSWETDNGEKIAVRYIIFEFR